MHLIIYQPIAANQKTFVEFWAARYAGYDDAFYEANVGQDLSESRILEWFTWKNGTPLSQRKRQSVLRNFVARRSELVHASDETAAELLEQFSKGGAIWRIFWLHCWQPARFPIYYQHVHRAMRVIQAGVREEIPSTETQKLRTYLDSFMPFHGQFTSIPHRQVYKALWAFGKFIDENNFPVDTNRGVGIS